MLLYSVVNFKYAQITKETQGISDVYHGREKVNGRGQLDGFKTYRDPKTIYDPKIYTDEQIFEMGKKAAVKLTHTL